MYYFEVLRKYSNTFWGQGIFEKNSIEHHRQKDNDLTAFWQRCRHDFMHCLDCEKKTVAEM